MTEPYAGAESLLEVARRMIAGGIEIPPIARTLGFTCVVLRREKAAGR